MRFHFSKNVRGLFYDRYSEYWKNVANHRNRKSEMCRKAHIILRLLDIVSAERPKHPKIFVEETLQKLKIAHYGSNESNEGRPIEYWKTAQRCTLSDQCPGSYIRNSTNMIFLGLSITSTRYINVNPICKESI